jgi:hypothetical protein
LSVEQLADAAHLSPRQFSRLDATERRALVELASGLEHQAERLEKQQTAATKSLRDG